MSIPNRYWFTMHWAHPAQHSHIPWNVFLQSNQVALGRQLNIGDLVVFYETSSGKAQRFDGEQEFVRATRGRSGVIGIATVSGGVQRSGLQQLEYRHDLQLRFTWEVPCSNHLRGTHRVPHDQTLVILKTGDPYIVRGGLREITREEFQQFESKLRPLIPAVGFNDS